MPEHPEDVCRRCGGPNVSWFAPSPLWNAVMRGWPGGHRSLSRVLYGWTP